MSSKVAPEGLPPASKEKHPFIIYYLTMVATIGGFLFGYNLGIINGANLIIKKEFSLDDKKIEQVVSAAIAAAAVFALMSGAIADSLGRKKTIMAAAVVFTVGGVVLGFANGFHMLLIGRFIVGAAIGVVSNVVPVYVSECAPANIRGRLITFNQLFITLGIFLSSIFAGAFQNVTDGWRYMLGLSAIPGLIQFVCFFTLPESPRYQAMKGQISKANASLVQIRRKQNVTEELNEIMCTLEEEKPMSAWCVLKGIFTTRHVRYALFVGCMLQLFQQFCGINSVIFYSSNILKSAGFDVRLAIWLSVIPFTVNFLATFLGIWAVEVLGRTKVLAASYIAIAVALWVLVAAFLPTYINPARTHKMFEMNITGTCLEHNDCWDCIQDNDCAFCGMKSDQLTTKYSSCVQKGEGDDAELYSSQGRCSRKPGTDEYMAGDNLIYSYGYCPSPYASLAVVGLILYVLGFAPGAGPMPWTINAEIYPMRCRSIANSLATVTNWCCNFFVGNFFLTVTKEITSWGTFLAFSVICLLGAIFTLLVVPETKNLSLEEIEAMFMTTENKKAYLARKMTTKEAFAKSTQAAVHVSAPDPRLSQAGGDALGEDVTKKDEPDVMDNVTTAEEGAEGEEPVGEKPEEQASEGEEPEADEAGAEVEEVAEAGSKGDEPAE